MWQSLALPSDTNLRQYSQGYDLLHSFGPLPASPPLNPEGEGNFLSSVGWASCIGTAFSSLARSSFFSLAKSAMTTVPPSEVMRRVVASPMPEAAPVMRMTLF